MTGHKIDFIALDGPLKTSRLLLVNQPLPQMRGHVLYIIFYLTPVSWAICRLDRFKPMKYRHRIQTRNGWW